MVLKIKHKNMAKLYKYQELKN